MAEVVYDNAIYEEINPVKNECIDIKKNDCYAEVKKFDDSIFKSPKDKSSSKNIVVVMIMTFATLVLLLGAIAASTGYVLLEISKLRTEMASDRVVILQQNADLTSKLDKISQLTNSSIETIQQEQSTEIQKLQNVTANEVETLNFMVSQLINSSIELIQQEQSTEIQKLQNVTANEVETLNFMVSQLINSSIEMTQQEQSTEIQKLKNVTADEVEMLNFRISQVLTSSENATQQILASISTLQQQSARNDSTLDASIATTEYQLRDIADALNRRCGGPGWRRVGYLNMTDPSQSCPSGLALKTYSPGLRSCGRASTTPGCWSTFYNTSGSQYSRVCGRVRGYQFGATGAFFGGSSSLDGNYVNGVSLTHGPSGNRTHIWTFAAGLSEVHDGRWTAHFCPCVTSSALHSPSFVGNDYFCESGLHTHWVDDRWIFYPDDSLWDGQNCVSRCCEFNNPPYFIKTLPAPTSNQIELRVCDRYRTISDSPIDQLELYVQ